MSKYLLIADTNYGGSQATVITALNALATPTVLYDQNVAGQVEQWARAWAQSKGIQFISLHYQLDSMGIGDAARRAGMAHALANPDGVITFGTGGHIVAVNNVATSQGKTTSKN